MQLDSYLELFTTLYGWAFANLLGEILTGTGLAALPFALIVFSAWHSAKEEGAGFNGVLALIESIQTKLITALLVMALCFATTPLTSLHNINLSYKPERAADGSEPQVVSTQGGTNSGYDRAMADAVNGSFARSGNLSYVPLWWYSVMGLSSGINGAFRAGMTSSERDLRVVADLARMATIEDPALLHDVQRFYSECFVPARSQYFSMDKNQISANGRGILAEGSIYGPTDVDWVGSQFFRTEPGFYDVMRSYNPVPGWSIDFNRDSEYMQGGASDQGFMNRTGGAQPASNGGKLTLLQEEYVSASLATPRHGGVSCKSPKTLSRSVRQMRPRMPWQSSLLRRPTRHLLVLTRCWATTMARARTRGVLSQGGLVPSGWVNRHLNPHSAWSHC